MLAEKREGDEWSSRPGSYCGSCGRITHWRPARGELTAFAAASHLARSVTRSKGRRWREE